MTAGPSSPTLSTLGPAARFAFPLLLLGAGCIAFAPIFVRLSEVGPVATAFWRVVLALPVLLVWRLWELRHAGASGRTATRSSRGGLAAAGLFFAGDLAVWHWSIQFTSVANATLLANFAPVFVALFGWLLFRQGVSRPFIIGLCLSMGGAVLLMGNSFSVSATHLFGDVLGIVTAMFYAGYILAVGRLRETQSVAMIMLVSGLITAAALLPVAVVSGERFWPESLNGWMVLLGLGLFSHALGQSLIAFALAHLAPAFSSVTLLLQPALAAALAWLLLNEPLGPLEIVGALVILAGIFQCRRAMG